ncbi:MAG: 16S rRNA (cytosine(1402)-N(4))-methyltransferase RsmH [Pseudomonadota bacterium]
MDHQPVLLEEMLQYLAPVDNETYIDATFGAGGYSSAILDKCKCNIIAIDRDKNVMQHADKLAKQYPSNFTFINERFSMLKQICAELKIDKLHGIVMDLGVSSMQLDQAERGFSFNKAGPLNMDMGQSDRRAIDLINNEDEKILADIIYNFGDERNSRAIARNIVKQREILGEITTTEQLSEIISAVNKKSKDGIHPATKTFQAIRIWVNQELEEIHQALEAAKLLLEENGRLVVITFHSIEDKIVKDFLRKHSGYTNSPSRYQPYINDNVNEKAFKIITRKAVKPTDGEVKNNRRARSAKLRAGLKIKNNKTN